MCRLVEGKRYISKWHNSQQHAYYLALQASCITVTTLIDHFPVEGTLKAYMLTLDISPADTS